MKCGGSLTGLDNIITTTQHLLPKPARNLPAKSHIATAGTRFKHCIINVHVYMLFMTHNHGDRLTAYSTFYSTIIRVVHTGFPSQFVF